MLYWSSTEYVGLTRGGQATAFAVNFATGHIKGYPQEMENYVRLVRGEPYGGNSFVDNEDSTVTDTATGLIWNKGTAAKDSTGKMPFTGDRARRRRGPARSCGGSSVKRADLDGSNIETVVDHTAGVGHFNGRAIVIVHAPGNVPAVSTWGLMILGILVFTVGSVLIGRRRVAIAA